MGLTVEAPGATPTPAIVLVPTAVKGTVPALVASATPRAVLKRGAEQRIHPGAYHIARGVEARRSGEREPRFRSSPGSGRVGYIWGKGDGGLRDRGGGHWGFRRGLEAYSYYIQTKMSQYYSAYNRVYPGNEYLRPVPHLLAISSLGQVARY